MSAPILAPRGGGSGGGGGGTSRVHLGVASAVFAALVVAMVSLTSGGGAVIGSFKQYAAPAAVSYAPAAAYPGIPAAPAAPVAAPLTPLVEAAAVLPVAAPVPASLVAAPVPAAAMLVAGLSAAAAPVPAAGVPAQAVVAETATAPVTEEVRLELEKIGITVPGPSGFETQAAAAAAAPGTLAAATMPLLVPAPPAPLLAAAPPPAAQMVQTSLIGDMAGFLGGAAEANVTGPLAYPKGETVTEPVVSQRNASAPLDAGAALAAAAAGVYSAAGVAPPVAAAEPNAATLAAANVSVPDPPGVPAGMAPVRPPLHGQTSNQHDGPNHLVLC